MMSKNRILYIIIAFVVLFIIIQTFYFNYKLKTELNIKSANQNQKIGYFDLNAVQRKCSVFKQLNQELENIEKKNKEITNEYREKLLKKVDEFEKNNRGKTKLELTKIQTDISFLEDDIHQRIDYHSKSYTLKNYQIKKEIRKRITSFLKKYCKEKGYSFILEADSDLVFYKDQSFDITQEIIDGITLEENLHLKK